MYEEELRKFALIAKVDLLREREDGSLELVSGMPEDNPVWCSAELREKLRSEAVSRELPYLMKDEFDVYFAAFCAEGTVFYLGPMSTVRLERVQERRFYRSYGITLEDVRSLRFFTLQEILWIVELSAGTLTGRIFREGELLKGSGLVLMSPGTLKKELALFVLQEEDINEDDEVWRHTFREEKNLLDAVREGRPEDAVRISRLLDEDDGRLSAKDLEHWKNLAVVGITLCSRAAIEGGLSPQSAYRISGYYIGKCSPQTSATQILGMRDYAIRDLAERVREKQKKQSISNYTEACRTYVSRHYREKLYLDDIAEKLGISPTYLSRLFKRDTGIRLQDYIVQVRVERAANLLRYSDQTIAEIAQYVHFPSQSYLGKAFRREMHMTPKEYRTRYQTVEWQKPKE